MSTTKYGTEPNTRQKALPILTGKPHIYIAHLNLPDKPRTPVLCWTDMKPYRFTRGEYKNVVAIERSWWNR